MLLNILDLRVVVNEQHIYPLQKERPVLVPVAARQVSLVVSDGFHITRRLQVDCALRSECHLYVVCRIDDNLLYTGVLLTVLFFAAGMLSGSLLAQMLSFFPVGYLIYWFYLRRADFLQVRMVNR